MLITVPPQIQYFSGSLSLSMGWEGVGWSIWLRKTQILCSIPQIGYKKEKTNIQIGVRMLTLQYLARLP